MYYVLVKKINNEIHNLLQFTILLTKNAHLYILIGTQICNFIQAQTRQSVELDSGFACNSFFLQTWDIFH